MKENRSLKIFDLFGRPFTFTINGNLKHQTNLGGFFTIFYILLCFLLSFILAKDFFDRDHPKVLNQNKELINYPLKNISNPELTIAWRIEDAVGNQIDTNNLLYPTSFHYFYKNEKAKSGSEFVEKEAVNIPSRNCKQIEDILEPTFKSKYFLNQWNCFDFSVLPNNVIGGYWNTDFLYYFDLILNTCNENREESDEKICTNFDSLQNLIDKDIYISFLMPQIVVEYEEYDNPKKTNYINHFVRLNLGLSTYDICDLTETVLIDDKGIALESIKYSSTLGYNKCQSSPIFQNIENFKEKGKNKEIYIVEFYLKKKINEIKRFYMKIQEAAALMGGCQTFIFLLLRFLLRFFNDYHRNKILMDLVFKYPIDEKETKDIYEEIKKINNFHLEKKKKEEINNQYEPSDLMNSKKSKLQRIKTLKEINNKVNSLKKNIRDNQIPDIKFINDKNLQENSEMEKKDSPNQEIELGKKRDIPLPNNKSHNDISNFTLDKNNNESVGLNKNLINSHNDNTLRNLNPRENENENENNNKDLEKNSEMWVSIVVKNLINRKRKLFSEIKLNYLTFILKCCRSSNPQNRDFEFFDQAVKNISKSIDLLRYVKNYQVTKTLSKLILNNEQSFYLKNVFQKIIRIPPPNQDIIKEKKRDEKYDKMLSYIETLIKGNLNNLNQIDEAMINNIFEI